MMTGVFTTDQDEHWTAYWRTRGKALEAVLDDWEDTIGSADQILDEDLRAWLAAARERLVQSRAGLSMKRSVR